MGSNVMDTVEARPAAPRYPYFTEEQSEAVVSARMTPDVELRLREVMTILVRHLHAAVKEIKPSHEEWLQGIQFLSQVGHMCTDWRQEFILLSDTLGVSMLVGAINHHPGRSDAQHHPRTLSRRQRAALRERLEHFCLDGKGEPLVVRGRVLDAQGNAVAGATLDVWQTNDDGFYDVQQKGVQPGYNLRGVFTSDAEGHYWLRTVKPRFYPIPDDGHVGRMLTALGRHPNRAAHIHFIITARDYDPVITHIFSPDCQDLPEDAVFGVKDELIGTLQRVTEPDQARALGVEAPTWLINWDFVLAEKLPASGSARHAVAS
jgi:hydroxyquinol 1,2-dioxygenase